MAKNPKLMMLEDHLPMAVGQSIAAHIKARKAKKDQPNEAAETPVEESAETPAEESMEEEQPPHGVQQRKPMPLLPSESRGRKPAPVPQTAPEVFPARKRK